MCRRRPVAAVWEIVGGIPFPLGAPPAALPIPSLRTPPSSPARYPKLDSYQY
jgi:hypothetical protein